MKILHLTERFRDGAVGGAQVSVDVLAEAQAAKEHEVTVVSMCESSADEKNDGGIRSIKLPLRPAYRSLRDENLSLPKSLIAHVCDGYLYGPPNGLSQIIEEVKPDVVHSHVIAGFSTAIWKRARQNGAVVVHTIRDYYMLCARSTCYKHGTQCQTICGECKFLRARAGFHSKAVDAVIGISQFILKAHVQRGIFRDTPIKRVIPNSVDLTWKGEKVGSSRGSGVIFGFLGRIVELKGIWELIPAFQKQASQDDLLLIAGHGSENTLGRLSQIKDPRIQFVGYRDPTRFFSDIDILVVPSLWEEPFGRIAAESLRSGVPVLGSRRGGVPEIISQPELGLLYNPDESGSLENGLSLIKQSFVAGRYDSFLIAKRGEIYSPGRIYQSYDDVYTLALQGAAKASE